MDRDFCSAGIWSVGFWHVFVEGTGRFRPWRTLVWVDAVRSCWGLRHTRHPVLAVVSSDQLAIAGLERAAVCGAVLCGHSCIGNCAEHHFGGTRTSNLLSHDTRRRILL